MALEWVVLGYAAAAEAVMVILLTLPGTYPLRKGLLSVTRNLLKPFLSVVPFCMFLLLDIYWKYETRPNCKSAESCTPTELMRHQKSVVKSQRNALLIAAALMFYWLLYSVTRLVTRVEQLNQRVDKLQNQEATGQIQVERAWKGSGKSVRDFRGSGSTGSQLVKASARVIRQWVKRTSIPAIKVSLDDYLLTMESVVCSREYPRIRQFVQVGV
ncbi:hypothetical protein HAX54_044081, partial [Datura stramonium]|nr:hypothetical protein [Datura stramonium]